MHPWLVVPKLKKYTRVRCFFWIRGTPEQTFIFSFFFISIFYDIKKIIMPFFVFWPLLKKTELSILEYFDPKKMKFVHKLLTAMYGEHHYKT